MLHRLHKTKQNRQFRAQALGYDDKKQLKKKKKDQLIPVLERDQIEEMLVSIQTIHDHVFFRRCEENSDKIGQFVTSFTRSIAEAPFKYDCHIPNFYSPGPRKATHASLCNTLPSYTRCPTIIMLLIVLDVYISV